jgi:hypothetical protein
MTRGTNVRARLMTLMDQWPAEGHAKVRRIESLSGGPRGSQHVQGDSQSREPKRLLICKIFAYLGAPPIHRKILKDFARIPPVATRVSECQCGPRAPASMVEVRDDAMTAGKGGRCLHCQRTESWEAGGRAFTLIELARGLLALFAVLASLLLPALSGARARARSLSCLSHLRQWAVGFTLYAPGQTKTVCRKKGISAPGSITRKTLPLV